MNKKNLLLLGILVILALIIGSISDRKRSSAPAALPSKPIAIPIAMPKEILPLFRDIPVWNPMVTETFSIGDGTYQGVSTTSLPVESDDYVLNEKFFTYYDKKLLAAGWVMDNTVGVGGVGSAGWGYIKNNALLYLYYSTEYATTIEYPDRSPDFNCPCNVTYKIFYGVEQL